jgi:cellulose biosynthesis protein BcsQ
MKKKNMIIVHSIKGGCGKTTISLILAQYLGKKEDPGKVCYIDADLVGVGTAYLAGEDLKDFEKRRRFMSDFVLLNPFDDPEFFKISFEDAPRELFQEFVLVPSLGSNRHFKAIFSSPNKDVMEKAIRATSDQFFAEDVKSKIRVLIKKLFSPLENKSEKEIDTIILDTSPGIHGLTSTLLELATEFSREKEYNIIKVIVGTNNFSHLNSLADHISEKKGKKEEIEVDKIEKNINRIIVINQIPIGVEFKNIPDKDFSQEEEWKKTTPDDPSLKEFSTYLKRVPPDEELEVAFRRYYSTRSKRFFPTFIKQKNGLSPEIEKELVDQVVCIPDEPSIRERASYFGDAEKFNSNVFFERISKLVKDSHFRLIGEKIDGLIKKIGGKSGKKS